MAYSDFEFYTSIYKGTLSEVAFERLSERASDYIDGRTNYVFCSSIADDIAVRLKKACCAVADAYYKNESGGGKASESVDGYSVSYIAGVSKAKTDAERLDEALRLYLNDYVRSVSWI